MAGIKFYLRSGKRVSIQRVESAKRRCAEMYRTGKNGNLPVAINPAVADSVDRMSLIRFCQWSGNFTYRHDRR